MDKAGLNNFKPEIEDLLLDIEKEAVSSYNRKIPKKKTKMKQIK